MDVVRPIVGIEQGRAGLGLRHAALVLVAPRSVFQLVEDTGAYGWALLTLLLLILLIGCTEVQTGLIDNGVDRQTEKQLSELEESQAHLIERVELRVRMEAIREGGEFKKMMSRLGVMVAMPVLFLSSFLLMSALLYAVVALTGRKPEYHTLMSICVYAGFIELVGLAVRMAMILAYRTNDVNTSLAMLTPPGLPTLLVAADPFRIWFWVLMTLGLIVTRQLSRRMAICTCTLMALVASGAHIGISFASHG